ncbi:RNA dependent RNA polymerase [Diatom colony associated dsRNA virus 10]|uniref:RNA dependent RNA polymerase n=1 Tax=Diatom colony associated dsRNA virus 10 TaxID=1678170 RepID=UPI0007A67F08|nr:RNA dependent RNA polymerase [Diatom colony associated dsRNA virus 10]BAU79504.1 RNA dependent RNA polymerase [Diatom colony associated dsRNA virus 10]
MSSIEARINELGSLGTALAKRLSEPMMTTFPSKPVDEQVYDIYTVQLKDPVKAAAMSMLLCKYPVQVDINVSDIIDLLPVGEFVGKMKEEHGDFRFMENGRTTLPTKAHPGATNKVNVYFSNLLQALREEKPGVLRWLLANQHLFYGLHDDSASALLLAGEMTSSVFARSYELYSYLIHNPDDASALNVVIKSLGLNSKREGAMLCESKCLQGRSVEPVSKAKEVDYRISKRRARKKTVRLDRDRLYQCIVDVISSELPRGGVNFADPDDHWDRRWLWCVNGAHSSALSKFKPQYVVDFSKRMHRKVFAENIASCPIQAWDSVCYFVLSTKLELGKARAIFGGDSVSYFCFDHLLKPIEDAWRNKRVRLDPGKGGVVGVVDEIRKLGGEGWNVMLDYDDFNSQHSLESQKLVIQAAVEVSGYDRVLGAALIASFDKSFIVEGDKAFKLEGTLMSGHRATTFINSVLNMAYILYAYPQLWEMKSLHVGDDVYISARDVREAIAVLDRVQSVGVRMNPVKQSVGTSTAEFLRIAMGKRGACGYLCRSIGSVISGNWVSENKLNPREALNTMIQAGWTLRMRGGVKVGWLLRRDMARVTNLKHKICEDLIDGVASVDGSPVQVSQRYNKSYTAELVDDEEPLDVRMFGGRSYATEAYLSKCTTPVEVRALELAGGDVKDMMVRSSYTKTLISYDVVRTPSLTLRATGQNRQGTEAVYVESLVGTVEVGGELTKYPLVNFVRDMLSERDCVALLGMIGIRAERSEAKELAFGSEVDVPTFVNGALPFSDARTLRGVAGGRVMMTRYPIRF